MRAHWAHAIACGDRNYSADACDGCFGDTVFLHAPSCLVSYFLIFTLDKLSSNAKLQVFECAIGNDAAAASNDDDDAETTTTGQISLTCALLAYICV